LIACGRAAQTASLRAMKPTSLLSPLLVLLLASVAPAKSASRELETEYEQVRKIALKDSKVRAAFDRANETLNRKIIEIDPSLKPIVNGQSAAKPKSVAGEKPAAIKSSKPDAEKTYTVVKGDTLTSIAARFGVSVVDLKSANGIVDERKLQIGQKLHIPKSRSGAPTAAKTDDSWWSRVKSNF